MFISQIKKFKKCKDIEDMWFLLLPYFCRFNILLYFHVYQQLRKIIQNWSGRETIARKSEWVSRVCTQKKLTLDTFFKNRLLLPLLSFGRLEWTRTWKNTTDITEWQLFVQQILKISNTKCKYFTLFVNKLNVYST